MPTNQNNLNKFGKQQTSPSSLNEKEIQIQRVSTSQNDQLLNNNNNISNNKLKQNDLNQKSTNNQEYNSNNLQQFNKNGTLSPANDKSASRYLSNHEKNFRQYQQIQVPQFHYPNGRPESKAFKTLDDPETIKAISALFKSSKDGKIFREDFGEVLKPLGLPRYWKSLLFRACTLNSKINYVTYPILEQVWSK